MTSELDIFAKLKQINDSEETLKYVSIFPYTDEHAMMVSKHRAIQRLSRPERPSTATTYRVGIYIRYFNQTKYENYLDYHIKQYQDTLALCPNWTLVDFYIDEGATAPNMETAKEWSRCLNDAIDGKFDLIITQKVSNISENNIDVIGLYKSELEVCIEIFFVRGSKMIGREHYFFPELKDMEDSEILSGFIKQYYL